MPEPARVLIIRLGALGDIVQSFGPFAAIRAHHPAAHITLLTTAPFADWLRPAPWFDAVKVDARPAWWQLASLHKLRRQLRGFHMVYDLQTSGRSTRYFWLAGRPPWSGIGRFASHKHREPNRDRLHTRDRQAGQLRDAGIAAVPPLAPDALAPLLDHGLPVIHMSPYAVLIPGASPHRPEKRWPAERFAELADRLLGFGLMPAIAGSAADAGLGGIVRGNGPANDFTGKTTLGQLAGLLADARVVIGNDTGPMHLAAALGRPCVVLFGGASDPALTAPRLPDGTVVTVLREPDLRELTVDRVAAALR